MREGSAHHGSARLRQDRPAQGALRARISKRCQPDAEQLLLVSWSGEPVAVAADPVDDLVGCLGPAERAGLFVPDLDPFLKGCLECVD